jgi:2-hydroxy-3-keto-5-methylthiopentenyl-1-phosphate phosphatase
MLRSEIARLDFCNEKNLYDTEYKTFDDSLKRLYKFLLQNRIRHDYGYGPIIRG